MKSKFFLQKFFGFAAILVLGIGTIISCEGGGDSFPNLTGEWVGTFDSSEGTDSFEVYFDISKQTDDQLEGTWTGSSIFSITPGSVRGFVYRSDDSRWSVSLSLSRGTTQCCYPIAGGCYDRPIESLDLTGYFENESVVDEDAGRFVFCGIEKGTMKVFRQQQ